MQPRIDFKRARMAHATATAPTPPREILSADEAADLVRCSVRTIYRRVRDGLLPAARTVPGRGGHLLLRRDDVLRAFGFDAPESEDY